MTRIGDAYRWVQAHVTTRPTNYSWVIKDKLAGSGIPMTHSQFLWVLAHGIKTIITVREVPLPAHWLTNNINHGNNLEYLHLKVQDYGAPSLEQLDITVDYIKKQIDSGKPVMVHCAAGKGRTGTILAALSAQRRRKYRCRKSYYEDQEASTWIGSIRNTKKMYRIIRTVH